MSATLNAKPRRKPDTLADVLRDLGDIPPDRVLWDPYPGTATEGDLLRCLDNEPKRMVELVEGVLVEKPMGAREGYMAQELSALLRAFVLQHNLGFVGGDGIPMQVGPTQTRVPDASFTSWERQRTLGKKFRAVFPFAPDLAVEVLSPTNTKGEMARKIREYFQGGSIQVWVIDPEPQTVTVYTSPKKSKLLTIDDTLDGGKVLPGFSIKLFDFFNSPQVTLIPPN